MASETLASFCHTAWRHIQDDNSCNSHHCEISWMHQGCDILEHQQAMITGRAELNGGRPEHSSLCLMFPQPWLWSVLSSEMWRRVVLYKSTDVSEVHCLHLQGPKNKTSKPQVELQIIQDSTNAPNFRAQARNSNFGLTPCCNAPVARTVSRNDSLWSINLVLIF